MRCHSLIGVRRVSTCGDIVTRQGEKGGTENQSPSGVRYVSIWGRKIFAVTGPGQVRRASVEGLPQCGQPECSEGIHAKGGPAWMGCQPRQGEKCTRVGVGDTSQCGVSQPEKIEVLCAWVGGGEGGAQGGVSEQRQEVKGIYMESKSKWDEATCRV